MGISIDKVSKQTLIFYSLAAMLIGLFSSRVLLSASMIFFIILTCFHKNFLRQLKFFIRHKFLVGTALLFFIPFISGLWSADTKEWLDLVRIKLPLLFFPIAFAGSWQFPKSRWLQLAFIFLILVFAGTLWSLWQYLQNTQVVHEAYLRAKTLPTPLENDHVRFSWMVCMAAILALFLLEKIRDGLVKILLAAATVFFMVYLHILSARTGLFCLYIFSILYILRWLFSKKKYPPAIALIVLILLMPVMAWLVFPTFQNRTKYIVYDFSFIKKNAYLQGSNDGNRLLSLKAGWSILQQNPWGVGAGDLIHETKQWYTIHVPEIVERDKIYPSSEWLIYGGAAGWVAFMVFTAILLIPLFEKRMGEKFFWNTLNGMAALSFLFDIGLEVQFGVFIYIFMVSCWWKTFNENPALL